MNAEVYQREIIKQSPLFSPLDSLVELFPENWPDLDAFNAWLAPNICNAQGQAIKFVAQDYSKKKAFEVNYEQRIYLKGEVQTRLHNWHDFFNACCWLRFPKTKALLNQLQYEDMLGNPPGTRTRQQNVLTQFDECGLAICCDNPDLVQLVKEHQWQDLFWGQRQQVLEEMEFVIFGHALYEKAIAPYIGFTGKAIFLPSNNNIDSAIAGYFEQQQWQAEVKPLQPLPLLGVPGWHPDQSLAFYQNKNYFRVKS